MMVAREISCATSSLHGHNVTDSLCRSQFHWQSAMAPDSLPHLNHPLSLIMCVHRCKTSYIWERAGNVFVDVKVRLRSSKCGVMEISPKVGWTKGTIYTEMSL